MIGYTYDGTEWRDAAGNPMPGQGVGVIGSSRLTEQFGNGPLYSWEQDRDGRISDCRIDGRKVSPIEFKKYRAERIHG